MRSKVNLIIYEYPKCSTCKTALQYLDKHKLKYEKIDISLQPPSKVELQKMLKFYQGNLLKLFNTSGIQYRQLKLSDKIGKMETSAALDLLSKNGKLVKRPFLLTNNNGRVGFKKEEWDLILGLA